MRSHTDYPFPARTLPRYYANPQVRARLLEFLGGRSLEEATCVYVMANGDSPLWYAPRSVRDFWRCLEAGQEVARSLWDRKSLIVHLDVDYVNFDFPAEPYLEPRRIFDIQRPVAWAIQEVLLEYGIAPQHLLSGRGHHFVWRVPRTSDVFTSLAGIGRTPSTLSARYAQPRPPTGAIVEPELGAAFAGLGLVLEFLAHRVRVASASHCRLPVVLTAVECGVSGRGREVISLDLSEYGDPLYVRSIRLPFTPYLKPWHLRSGLDSNKPLRPLFMIPLHEVDERQASRIMPDADAVSQLARRASVQIPDQSQGTQRLVAAYSRSRLSAFHDAFYSVEHDSPDTWWCTYDRTPMDPLPPCVRRILEQPNDLLLKPAGIQHVVWTLLDSGWHPRHVAGLIRSKYERDSGWGHLWYHYDAATRADFYTRVFAGLLVLEHNSLSDFNCRSTREIGYCPNSTCNGSVDEIRNHLLSKRAKSQEPFAGRVKSLGTAPWETIP